MLHATTARTSTLSLAESRADLARADTNHAQSLGLVEGADLLLRLAEHHAVLQLAQLRLRIGLFGFPGSGKRV